MGKPYYKASMEELYCRDAIDILKELPSESVNCIITSPPYWAVRKYGNSNKELGQERFFQEYVRKIVKIFDEAKRILKKEGTCWINLGDIYAGNKIGKTDNKVNSYLKQETKGLRKRSQSSVKDKSLCNIPHRFAIAMIDRGWIHRNTIIWYKRNAMPASVKDRFTVDYEFIFFFVKSKKYYFKQQFEPYLRSLNRWGGNKLKADGQSGWDGGTGQNTYRDRNMRPNPKGRNLRCVWDIPTIPSNIPHFAMWPEKLVARMIEAGCPENGIILDPFAGAGNTLIAAKKLGRKSIGIEIYEKYIEICKNRLKNIPLNLF